MKAELRTVLPDFEPLKLNIVIESKEEYEALNILFAYNNTVTRSLVSEEFINYSQREKLKELMENIHNLFEENS
jgi:hypothetical protein